MGVGTDKWWMWWWSRWRSLLFAFHFQGNKRNKVIKLSSFLVHLLSRTDDFHIARSSGHFLLESTFFTWLWPFSLSFPSTLLPLLSLLCLVFLCLLDLVGLKIWTAFFYVVIPLFRPKTLNTRCMMMTPICVFLFLTSHWSLDLNGWPPIELPRYLTLHVQNCTLILLPQIYCSPYLPSVVCLVNGHSTSYLFQSFSSKTSGILDHSTH